MVFKVLIVGASVSGLSLALMLEKLGIDYLVLEAYPEVSAHVGAAVALLPNGLRILDQLGVYDDFKIESDKMPLSAAIIRSPEVDTLLTCNEVGPLFIERYGYPMIFMSRQKCLEILHGRIKHKEKILVNKKVTTIVTATSKVEIKTSDGSIYTGDIIVGGDGIHSSVRKEMWRLGREISPSHFEGDEMLRVPAFQMALFGISSPNSQFPKSEMIATYGNGHSFSFIVGTDLRIYWFLFVNFDRTLYGDEIPRCTKEDELKLAEKHSEYDVAPGLKFKDLYNSSERTVMTALHEHVFQKWHFQRIATLGDAAHKFNPMTGQGANSAIETAAAISNALHRKLKERERPLSGDDIESIFSAVQEKRWDHVKFLVDRSTQQAKFESLSSVADEFAARVVLPWVDAESFIASFDIDFLNAQRLDWTDIPYRPRRAPFYDELPEKPVVKTIGNVVAGLVAFVLVLCVGLSTYSSPSKESLVSSWTQNQPLFGRPIRDAAVLNSDVSPIDIVPTLRLLTTFVPILLIWTLEAQRARNKLTLLRWPGVFVAAAQWFHPGIAVPLYYLASIWTSQGRAATGNQIPLEVWRAIPPAIFLGLIVPVVSIAFWQEAQIFWQLSPFLVSLLTNGGAFFLKRYTATTRQRATAAQSDASRDTAIRMDLSATSNTVYGVSVAFLAIIHLLSLIAIAAISNNLDTEMAWVRLPLLAISTSVLGPVQPTIFFVSTAIFCAYSIYQIRERGLIGTSRALTGIATALVSALLLGPSAAYAGTMWWIERINDEISQLAKSAKAVKVNATPKS